MAEAARRRRAQFASHEEALAAYASKRAFRGLDPEVLRLYITGGFREVEGGIALKCRPEDEAAVFEGAREHDAFERLGEVRCPVTVAGGSDSDIPASLVELVASRLPQGRAEVLTGKRHLLPFEEPALVAERIVAALSPS